MKEWLIITLCVSFYASFRDFRPVDSFYTSYLTSPAVNFTAKQVRHVTKYNIVTVINKSGNNCVLNGDADLYSVNAQ